MPRWPDTPDLEAQRLDGFTVAPADRPPRDEEARTFVLRFAARPVDRDETVALAFDGIATVFAVSLNGVEILRGDSMFLAHEVDVTALLRVDNVLVIACAPLGLDDVPSRPRQRWRTRVVPDGRLRFRRTTLLGRAPGFAPGPPIVGPWRPVWLVRRRGAVRWDAVKLIPRVDDRHAILGVRAPGAAGRVVVTGPSGEHAADLHDGRTIVRLENPARWWPHTHGTPALYDVRIGDTALGRVGFRTVAPGPDPDGLALAVNGVGVFARGAVWTPVPEAELRPTLEAARDAGMNLLRIPGIGVPETPAFFDLCDELGIMVWQDFLYANLDYPVADPAFLAAAEAEAQQVLAAVAHRPSLAVLCGNSEVEQQAAMAAGVAAEDARGPLFGEVLPRLARAAGVPYVPSAPSGGALPFHPGTGVASYFGVGGYRRPLSDARTAGVRFAAECLAFANLGDDDGDGWVPRDVGADWDFADVRDHYLRERYGVDAAALEPERARALGRQVTGEVMAAVLGEWRRAASPCAGALILWLRDLRPGAGWGLLDHRGAPKVALAHVRRALAPRALWLVDEGLGGVDVHLANDRPEPLTGTLRVALLAGGAHAIADGEAAVTVDGHGSARLSVEGVLGRFADASGAYRFGPLAHDAVVATLHDDAGALVAQACHFPAGPPLTRRDDLGLAASTAAREDGTVAVTLTTPVLAWGVRVAADGFAPADDALDVVPGVPRTVVLRPVTGAAFAGVTVTALNAY